MPALFREWSELIAPRNDNDDADDVDDNDAKPQPL